MDNPQTITHVSLCAGYGGIDLGLSRAIPSMRTVAFSEIEAFACANLVSKMEAGLLDCAPIWTNLKTFPWAEFYGRVDLLSGGYPCQPFSSAGKRLGTEDPRHLWPFIANGIRLMRPKLCFFENVEGHISLGLREVIGELEQMGYKVSWGIFSAREVGAPHQRKRVFILAYRESVRLPELTNLGTAWREIPAVEDGCMEHSSHSGWTESHVAKESDKQDKSGGVGNEEQLANSRCGAGAEGEQPPELRAVRTSESPGCSRVLSSEGQAGEVSLWPSRPGEPQHGWEPPRTVSSRMANAKGIRHSGLKAECGAIPNGCVSEMDKSHEEHSGESFGLGAVIAGEVLGNSDSPRPQERQGQRGEGIQGIHTNGGEDADRQTQPPLGRDSNGIASGMDYAELQVSCDNRTDELRLLGNGVVPATAERAFRTLLNILIER